MAQARDEMARGMAVPAVMRVVDRRTIRAVALAVVDAMQPSVDQLAVAHDALAHELAALQVVPYEQARRAEQAAGKRAQPDVLRRPKAKKKSKPKSPVPAKAAPTRKPKPPSELRDDDLDFEADDLSAQDAAALDALEQEPNPRRVVRRKKSTNKKEGA